MRGLFILAWLSIAFGAGVACAGGEENGVAPESDASPADDGGTEAAADDADDADVPSGPARCSGAGWCVTQLPDRNLVMRDIWPFEKSAYAIAESETLGIKVLGWDDSDPQWKYIDDDTQNEIGIGKFAGRIWAPSSNEIYYIISPGYIYHGTRNPPNGPWIWERKRIADESSGIASPLIFQSEARALGVWGTSADDVYAWYSNRIFHRKSVDGGPPDWVTEYILDDEDSPYEGLFVFGASATNKDDIWFAGGRGSNPYHNCPVVVRKTRDVYQRVFDGIISDQVKQPCKDRPGTLRLADVGWLTDVAAGDRRLVALRNTDHLTAIRVEDDGTYAFGSTKIMSAHARESFHSLWVSNEEAWLSGWGLIVHGPIPGGPFSVSTIALTEAPLDQTMYRVRGTGRDNIWAIGAHYALHKTTP
jgi:hypothetical protein